MELLFFIAFCLSIALFTILFSMRQAKKKQAASRKKKKLPLYDGSTMHRFEVIGVYQESQADAILHIDAISPENAAIKAQMQGIVVGGVKLYSA